MLEPLSSTEINRQQAEMLPARTVMSLFSMQGPQGGTGGKGGGPSLPSGPLFILTLFDHQTNTSSSSMD